MMAFERIEPFGSLWEDYRIGRLTAELINVHLKNDATPLQARDVFHTLREPEPDDDVDPFANWTDEQRAAALDAAFFGIAP